MKKFFFKFIILWALISCNGFSAWAGEEDEFPSLTTLCVRKIQHVWIEEKQSPEDIYRLIKHIPIHLQKQIMEGLSSNFKWNQINKTQNGWSAGYGTEGKVKILLEGTLKKIIEESPFDDLCFDLNVFDKLTFSKTDAQIIAQSPLKKITLQTFPDGRLGEILPEESPQTPLFEHLTHVTLEGFDVADEDILWLVHLPYLQKLTYLKLDTRLRNIGAWLIAKDPTFKNLTQLHFCEGGYGKKVVLQLISESAFLQNLTHLTLAATRAYARENDDEIDDEVAEEIAKSTKFGKLEVLDLNLNRIKDVGLEHIASSKNFPNLTTLDVSDNEFGDSGVLAFSKHPEFFPNLKKIIFNVSDEPIIEDISTYEILREAFHPRQLEIIDCQIKDERELKL